MTIINDMRPGTKSGPDGDRRRSRFFLIPMLIVVVTMICLISIILIRGAWNAI